MTREINGRIVMVVSDDGTRCAAECPHLSSSWCECTSFRAVVMRHEGGYLRAAACIAAEQAAASAEGVADMLRDDLHEVEHDARDMADQLNECARLLGCERGDVVRSLEAHLAGGRVVASMLVAREQAAASVPSCEAETLEAYAVWMQGQPSVMSREGTVRLMREHAATLRARGRAGLPQVFGAADDHIDGGARALDASEALREARVHGMREGARIMQECMRLWRGDPDGTMPDWENADTTLAAAIEAVRKGER